MRIVVTGGGGFIGGFLIEALIGRGDAVEGWGRRPGNATSTAFERVDIVDGAQVRAALAAFAPDAVVHLAAQSSPGRSWNEPAETYRINVGGAINILEAARVQKPRPRVLLAGSSAEYAEPANVKPLDEEARIEPNSPYAASKWAAAQLGDLYFRRYDLAVLHFRPFYLIGPRKTGDVCSDFARRIVAIERGAQSRMAVGDTSVVRDLMDVRDGVDALLRLIDRGEPGETYNVCSGQAVTIADVLQAFRAAALVPVEVVQDRTLFRPLEQKAKIGDPAKLRALGWTPTYRLARTLDEILAYWRSREEGLADAGVIC